MKSHSGWPAFRRRADKGKPIEAAFAYQITQNPTYARTAIEAALKGNVAEVKDFSLIFDWCYDQLNASQKTRLIDIISQKALIGSEPLPKPIYKQGTFHSEEWCGRPISGKVYAWVALAHDNPQAAQYFTRWWELGAMKDPTNLLEYLKDGTWAEGGYWTARAKFALMIDRFLLLKSATGEESASTYLNNIGYFVLYQADIHRKLLWHSIGDSNMIPANAWQFKKIMLYATHYAYNPYYQWFLHHVCEYKPGSKLEDILFYDPTLAEKPVEELPLTRFFPGYNLVLMRSDWGPHATHISFRANDYFESHSHFDVGSFIIYKNGYVLAPDTGLYTHFRNAHRRNYFMRTIAHNTMMIKDPNETITYFLHKVDQAVKKDGGQKWPGKRIRNYKDFIKNPDLADIGEILTYESKPLYDYVTGDITRAYSSKKLQGFIRTVLFIRKGYFVVFDRVSSTKKTFQKRWLLHLEGEPQVNGNVIKEEVKDHIISYDGHQAVSMHPQNGQLLNIKTLLPQKCIIKKIGGKGYSFWNEGKNYPPEPGVQHKLFTRAMKGEISIGRWRLEISPADSSKKDHFLNVIHIPDKNESMPSITLIEPVNMFGILINDIDSPWVSLFAKEGTSIQRTRYTADYTGKAKHLLGNMIPGSVYHIYQNGHEISDSPKTASDQGILFFRAENGKDFSVTTSN